MAAKLKICNRVRDTKVKGKGKGKCKGKGKDKSKGKAIPLQVWTGPEGSRRLRLPNFKTIGT